jgi:hypothetical protein
VIADDTLSTSEQNLILEAARAQIPLNLRVTEQAFAHAKKALDGTGPQELESGAVEPLLEILAEEGLPEELVSDPGVSDYLDWRLRMAFAQRVQHYDHALEYQAERDRVLAAAIGFLETTTSQADLFARIESEASKADRAGTSGSTGTRPTSIHPRGS